jgi:hypothetical protein
MSGSHSRAERKRSWARDRHLVVAQGIRFPLSLLSRPLSGPGPSPQCCRSPSSRSIAPKRGDRRHRAVGSLSADCRRCCSSRLLARRLFENSSNAAKAAALILSWTTAHQLLHRAARVQRVQRALVHGAAGAVGQALLVLGRLAGPELWGTASAKTSRASRRAGSTSCSGWLWSLAALKRGGLLCANGYTADV